MLLKNILFILLIHISGIFYAQDVKTLIYKGNRDFENKKYEESSVYYLKAVQKKPKDFGAHYNLGNALYKQKKYKEAQEEYQKAEHLTNNVQDKVAALYNRGNALMQQNKPQEAARYYKEALKLSPTDFAIRKNYEIAKLKDKQNKQNHSGEGKGDKQDNKAGQGEEPPQENKGDVQKTEQGNYQQDKGNAEGRDQNKNQGQEERIPRDMEKEILQQVGDKEKNTSKRILNQKTNSSPISNEKDW
ncbi:tetratricopeptide repeat protein [Elizabethkingia argentiflava]|uniref:Tetratricopeptide repeat protein n=1 Tax=Elizabethkingia argenteiflava TaxID=2681556 RepID=A0A845PT49_9FLAO|nr:tetratricopeptide repeat protein [Elizabethkingia argenteiflava]NAW50211.1 tetratricopeptide repeat protein [Elizabethkingia argenteiflava]